MVHRLHRRERRKNTPRRLLKGHLVWGIMYDCYRRDVWWWEGTVAVRKIVIALVGVFGTTIADGMQIHLVLMFVVLVILSTGQVSVWVAKKTFFSVLMLTRSSRGVSCVLTMFFFCLSCFPRIDTTIFGRQKRHVAFLGHDEFSCFVLDIVGRFGVYNFSSLH